MRSDADAHVAAQSAPGTAGTAPGARAACCTPAAVTPAPTSANGLWIVTALSIAQLIFWGSIYYGFSLFIVPMERDLGWRRTAMNGALSLGLLAAGLFAYPVGRWIDAQGGRWLMTACSLLAALLFFAWANAASLPTLFLSGSDWVRPWQRHFTIRCLPY